MTERTVPKFKISKKRKTDRQKIACLVIIEGGLIGEIYRLGASSTLIGRGNNVDIFLSEEGVSRQHVRIDKHEDSYTITDLSSTNGTLVNGMSIEQAVLHEGDKILIGELLLRFVILDSSDVIYQETLRNMALKDGLTEISNRHYLLETLNREVSYAMRLRQPLACIMFDIDHFKNTNDTFGHQAGDFVLRKVASHLSEGLRSYDVFARYGGEEFVVLLRATALDNALLFAERIRKRTENLAIEYAEKSIPVTISVGVVALNPDSAYTPEDLLKEADRYLYEAKKTGRNRVCSERTLPGSESK